MNQSEEEITPLLMDLVQPHEMVRRDEIETTSTHTAGRHGPPLRLSGRAKRAACRWPDRRPQMPYAGLPKIGPRDPSNDLSFGKERVAHATGRDEVADTDPAQGTPVCPIAQLTANLQIADSRPSTVIRANPIH